MRVVLDTNVLISALIAKGKPHELLETPLAGKHLLVLSHPTIDEFSRVAADEKIRRYVNDEELKTFLRVLLANAVYMRVRSKIRTLKGPEIHSILLFLPESLVLPWSLRLRPSLLLLPFPWQSLRPSSE